MKDIKETEEIMLICLELAKENNDILWINLMEKMNKSPDKKNPENLTPLMLPIYNKYKNQALLVKLNFRWFRWKIIEIRNKRYLSLKIRKRWAYVHLLFFIIIVRNTYNYIPNFTIYFYFFDTNIKVKSINFGDDSLWQWIKWIYF